MFNREHSIWMESFDLWSRATALLYLVNLCFVIVLINIMILTIFICLFGDYYYSMQKVFHSFHCLARVLDTRTVSWNPNWNFSLSIYLKCIRYLFLFQVLRSVRQSNLGGTVSRRNQNGCGTMHSPWIGLELLPLRLMLGFCFY